MFSKRQIDFPTTNTLYQTRLVDVPPAHRFMKFDRIEWNRTFYKRETILPTLASELQSYLGNTYLYVLVLHSIQFPNRLHSS